jgi:hypothetical protein
MPNWTVEELVTFRHRAEELANRWVRLQPLRVIPSGNIIYTNDGPIVILNDIVLSWAYVAKPRCPQWLKHYIKGRYYSPYDDDVTSQREGVQKGVAIAHITAKILVHWGFTGYVQDKLPF